MRPYCFNNIYLLESTQRAMAEGQHPMVVAAKWHGYYEYLHPFRDGNGRTGRMLSNSILLRAGHPLLIIKLEDRAAYISALKQIRTEGTDVGRNLFGKIGNYYQIDK